MPNRSDLRRTLSLTLWLPCSVAACSGGDHSSDLGLGGVATTSSVPALQGGATSNTIPAQSGGNSGLISSSTPSPSSGGTVSTSGTQGGTVGVGGTETTRVATGGTMAIGGNNATGGVSSTGGSKTTGGVSSTGGSKTTGGTTSTGGSKTTGDTTSTGGSKTTGGTTSTGGITATGGTKATGGTTAAGGTSASPCSGATKVITVAANGSGNFTTIQAAINSIAANNTALVQVTVKAGTYNEQVTISKANVCLVGDTAESTIISNTAGTNIVTGGTVLVSGNDFSAANLTFKNSAPDGSAQAVALMANGKRQQFINCRFVSYQDTLYVNTGTQYFKNCYIQGNTDYIFGDATAVFEGCTMNNVSEGTAVTAPRTPQGTTYGFVFIGGALTANPTTSTVRNNRVYLGRPWGPYAAATFINVALGAHIAADGWTTMSGNTLANTRFSEYGSTGAGANPTNATRSSRQLTAAQAANYTVANVLNPWVPSFSR